MAKFADRIQEKLGYDIEIITIRDPLPIESMYLIVL